MLWDCKYCNSPKLLGLTHRHCPVCGAPQDARARYFPSDAEKIAVKDHKYAGSDVLCSACHEATSRAAQHCGHCGAPLDTAREVRRREAQIAADAQAFSAETAAVARREFMGDTAKANALAAKPQKKRRWRAALVATAAALAALIAVFTWKQDAAVLVSSKAWERSIVIESFGPVSDSAWCDRMPAGARNVSKTREERDTRKVPDGETCTTKRKDNGDGTYSEQQECEPKYREEPVYDMKCRFTIDRWRSQRTEVAKSEGAASLPAWPAVRLAQVGTCQGCEREGARSETYTVMFKHEASGASDSCELSEERWQQFENGSRWQAQVRALTGGLDCDSLTLK